MSLTFYSIVLLRRDDAPALPCLGLVLLLGFGLLIAGALVLNRSDLPRCPHCKGQVNVRFESLLTELYVCRTCHYQFHSPTHVDQVVVTAGVVPTLVRGIVLMVGRITKLSYETPPSRQ